MCNLLSHKIGPIIFEYPPEAGCVMLRRNMAPSPHENLESSIPPPLVQMADDARSATSQPQAFRSKVYRAKEPDGWVVEPPRDMVSAVDKVVFTEPRAQQLALTYAYEKFGNARFFPY
jgi:hypothetical protein